MKTINSIIAMLALAAPSLWAAPMPAKAELLASNTVVAVYSGVQERPCMFRTALCPHRCGHATKVALFTVKSNEKYEKPGEYGDDKAEAGSVIAVDLLRDTPGQSEETLKLIAALPQGAVVRMTQAHYYGDFGDVAEPFRPVISIEKIGTDNKAAALPPAPAANRMLRRAR